MITVYHLEISRSERVIWLMEELGLPYKLERFARGPGMTAPPSLFEVHPLGKAPVIRDGDTVLAESGAILEYIIHRHGQGRLAVPADASNYARYLHWMHFAEGSAMLQFLLQLFLGGLVPGVDQAHPMVARVKQGSADILKYMDGELAAVPYLAGSEFTAADIMMMYCFGLVRSYLKTDMSGYGNINAWLARIEARPAYRKGMAIANPPA